METGKDTFFYSALVRCLFLWSPGLALYFAPYPIVFSKDKAQLQHTNLLINNRATHHHIHISVKHKAVAGWSVVGKSLLLHVITEGGTIYEVTAEERERKEPSREGQQQVQGMVIEKGQIRTKCNDLRV